MLRTGASEFRNVPGCCNFIAEAFQRGLLSKVENSAHEMVFKGIPTRKKLARYFDW